MDTRSTQNILQKRMLLRELGTDERVSKWAAASFPYVTAESYTG